MAMESVVVRLRPRVRLCPTTISSSPLKGGSTCRRRAPRTFAFVLDKPPPRERRVAGVSMERAEDRGYRQLWREAREAWCGRVGPAHEPAPADALQSLFNDLNLYPSKAQVFEMLAVARQSARRKEHTVAFGEFCFLAAHLRKQRPAERKTLTSRSDPPPTDFKLIARLTVERGCKHPLNSQSDADSQQVGQEPRRHPYQVFLGGSCNPTTWRRDVAVPALERMGITYFNPQVADWSSDLIEIEHQAKVSARVLFFVLDADTRAAAAAVEAAYLTAANRPLVLVLQPYRRAQRIGEEVITDQEYLDLSRGQAILQEVAERRNLPVFTELQPALKYTEQLVRGSRPYNPGAMASNVALHLRKAREAFDGADTAGLGKLTPVQAVELLRSYSGVELSLAHLENLIDMLSTQQIPEAAGSGREVTFQLFCLLVAEATEESDLQKEITKGPALEARPQPSGPVRWCPSPLRALLRTVMSLVAKIEIHASRVNDEIGNVHSSEAAFTNNNISTSKKCRRREGGSEQSGDAVPSGGLAKGRKLSVIIPKTPPGESTNLLTPQTSRRLEALAGSIKEEPIIRDVYLGGSCIIRTTWREEVVIPMLRNHSLTYYKPEMNDYNRIFSAPPYTPGGYSGGRFSFESVAPSKSMNGYKQASNGRSAHKNSGEYEPSSPRHPHPTNPSETSRSTTKHERSPSTASDQPEKKPKYSNHDRILSEVQNVTSECWEEVEVRRKEGPALSLQADNRLSASDFYKIPDNATPDPFGGMFDERQIQGSRVLLFGVTSDTRCLSPMVLASHCIGLRPRAVVLCVQLLQHVEGLSERAIKDYNRGRLYLKDLALREGVPVFDNMQEAAQCVIRKLQTRDY